VTTVGAACGATVRSGFSCAEGWLGLTGLPASGSVSTGRLSTTVGSTGCTSGLVFLAGTGAGVLAGAGASAGFTGGKPSNAGSTRKGSGACARVSAA